MGGTTTVGIMIALTMFYIRIELKAISLYSFISNYRHAAIISLFSLNTQ